MFNGKTEIFSPPPQKKNFHPLYSFPWVFVAWCVISVFGVLTASCVEASVLVCTAVIFLLC